MRASALFCAKNTGFFKIYGVSTRTRGEGLSQCGHFADKGRGGSIFGDFVRTYFMDGPLPYWKAIKKYRKSKMAYYRRFDYCKNNTLFFNFLCSSGKTTIVIQNQWFW